MFRCYHCGGCCEDVCTQINLTLGDISRLKNYTKKSALQLYKTGIIGVYPFGDPFKSNEFETDIGLFIPCTYRKQAKSHKLCSIYQARPLNCRLFPYWILAEAPPKEIKQLICPGHECMKHFEIDEDFKDDRKIYHEYKEKIVKILFEESKISDPFFKKLGLKKKFKTTRSKTKDDDFKVITKLVKELKQNDFSDIFKKIDKEIKRHSFISYKTMPILKIK